MWHINVVYNTRLPHSPGVTFNPQPTREQAFAVLRRALAGIYHATVPEVLTVRDFPYWQNRGEIGDSYGVHTLLVLIPANPMVQRMNGETPNLFPHHILRAEVWDDAERY